MSNGRRLNPVLLNSRGDAFSEIDCRAISAVFERLLLGYRTFSYRYETREGCVLGREVVPCFFESEYVIIKMLAVYFALIRYAVKADCTHK